MSIDRYNVVYQGKIVKGYRLETIQRNFEHLFGLSADQTLKLLKRRRVILKKAVDKVTGRKMVATLKRAGVLAALEAVSARPAEKPTTASMPAQPPPQPPPSPHPSVSAGKLEGYTGHVPIAFSGKGGGYFRIWIVNIILSILTLGIYSAWAKVRRKQYFYGHTRILDASFEYLADPWKILKGRIIIVTLFLAYSALSEFLPIVGTFLSFAFIFVLPWIVVRSLAFNARNSAWRNIRFGFSGKVGDAAKAFVLWPFLALVSLGILMPYSLYRQKQFVVANSRYGNTRFAFEATVRDFYRLFLSAIIPVLAGLALLLLAGFLLAPMAILMGVVLYFYLFAFLTVKLTNVTYNALRLDVHRFNAALAVKPFMLIVIGNALALVLTLGLFWPWARVRLLRYKLEHLSLLTSGDLDHFVAEERKQISALGDEAGDFFDFDLGL
jgi:uncharacterized membrane protein YjgN (DUF898 family)